LFKNFIDRLYALVSNKDGVRVVNFGKPKKGIAAVCCGAPDGNMIYHGVMSHLVIVFRAFGITDVSSGVIPKASPDTVKDSEFLKDLLDAVDFQLSA